MKRAQLSGVRDWFKKKPKTTLPILRHEEGVIYIGPTGEAKSQLPAPAGPRPTVKEQLLSLFQAFEEGKSTLPELARTMNLSPEQLPEIARKLDIIIPEEIKASPPKELTAAEETAQKEVWEELFQETKEEQGSMFDVFEGATEAEVAPAARYGAHRPEYADWPRGVQPLYWKTKWRLPSAFQVLHNIQQDSDNWDLPGLYEFTLQNTDYPGWRKQVQESPHTGEPATLEIDRIAHWSSAYEDLQKILKIPDQVMDVYFGEAKTDHQVWVNSRLFEEEVVHPYLENIGKALDALRPPGMRGWFEISQTEDLSWWLAYKETKYTNAG